MRMLSIRLKACCNDGSNFSTNQRIEALRIAIFELKFSRYGYVRKQAPVLEEIIEMLAGIEEKDAEEWIFELPMHIGAEYADMISKAISERIGSDWDAPEEIE